MKKKVNELEEYANSASRAGLTYGQKQQNVYAEQVKIGPVPAGYRKTGKK